MIYQSLMKLKGVAADALQATMNVDAKALTTLMEKGKLRERKLNFKQTEGGTISRNIKDQNPDPSMLSLFCQPLDCFLKILIYYMH